MAKYILGIYHVEPYPLWKLVAYYNGNMDLTREHIQLLLDNSAINVTKHYCYLHKLEFEERDELLEVFSKYIKKDMVDILKN
jgi:hypothetical protein